MSQRPERALLIVNPSARGGEAATMQPRVAGALRSLGWQVDEVVTTSPRHATELAEQADPQRDLLVALGGDGLLGLVAAGAIKSGALVAPLPGGRGSDFIRAINAPREVDAAVAALPEAVERRYDVGLADGKPFLGVATVGYDSRANDYANAAPSWMPGGLVYAYGGARALLETQVHRMRIEIDGRERTFTGWNIAIGNSGRYGAGMKVNPEASLTDGQLDLCTVENLPRWRYPMYLPRIFKGTHIDGERVRADRGACVTVHAPVGSRVYADGDIIGETPMTFTVAAGALRILAGVRSAS